MFMKMARLQISYKLLWLFTNGIFMANAEKSWNTPRICLFGQTIKQSLSNLA